MKKTLVVPIDFTTVSHEALLYACELSVGHDLEIVAVHILDTQVISQYNVSEDEEVRKVADQMYQDIYQKTKKDLDNFLDGLSVFYGDIIRPLIANGTIYEAFNEVAKTYNAPLIVMGTHGIVGMQHIFGSKAYKVILNSPHPFLVVQAKSYKPIKLVYLALGKNRHLYDYKNEICMIASLYEGDIIINIYDPTESEYVDLPSEIFHLGWRVKIQLRLLSPENNMVEQAHAAGADVIGMIIRESDNLSDTTFGLTQDKILVNDYKIPVFCLPIKSKKIID